MPQGHLLVRAWKGLLTLFQPKAARCQECPLSYMQMSSPVQTTFGLLHIGLVQFISIKRKPLGFIPECAKGRMGCGRVWRTTYSVTIRQFVCVSVRVIVIWVFTEDSEPMLLFILSSSGREHGWSFSWSQKLLSQVCDMVTYLALRPFSLLHSWPEGVQMWMGMVSQE